MKQPPFTKKELSDYITERGYRADVESMWLYYEKTEFCYAQGTRRWPLKNWKADINLKLRNGKFNARYIKVTQPKPRTVEPVNYVPVTPERKAEYRQAFDKMVKGMSPDGEAKPLATEQQKAEFRKLVGIKPKREPPNELNEEEFEKRRKKMLAELKGKSE